MSKRLAADDVFSDLVQRLNRPPENIDGDESNQRNRCIRLGGRSLQLDQPVSRENKHRLPCFSDPSEARHSPFLEAHELFTRCLISKNALLNGQSVTFDKKFKINSGDIAYLYSHQKQILSRTGLETHSCPGPDCALTAFKEGRPYYSFHIFEEVQATGLIFLCQHSGLIHLCDRECHGSISTEDGGVCPISGFLKDPNIMASHPQVSRDRYRSISDEADRDFEDFTSLDQFENFGGEYENEPGRFSEEEAEMCQNDVLPVKGLQPIRRRAQKPTKLVFDENDDTMETVAEHRGKTTNLGSFVDAVISQPVDLNHQSAPSPVRSRPGKANGKKAPRQLGVCDISRLLISLEKGLVWGPPQRILASIRDELRLVRMGATARWKKILEKGGPSMLLLERAKSEGVTLLENHVSLQFLREDAGISTCRMFFRLWGLKAAKVLRKLVDSHPEKVGEKQVVKIYHFLATRFSNPFRVDAPWALPPLIHGKSRNIPNHLKILASRLWDELS